MKEAYGVGRTAADTSRKALVKAGLIKEVRLRGADANYVKLIVTELRHKAVVKISEIASLIKYK